MNNPLFWHKKFFGAAATLLLGGSLAMTSLSPVAYAWGPNPHGPGRGIIHHVGVFRIEHIVGISFGYHRHHGYSGGYNNHENCYCKTSYHKEKKIKVVSKSVSKAVYKTSAVASSAVTAVSTAKAVSTVAAVPTAASAVTQASAPAPAVSAPTLPLTGFNPNQH